MDIESRLEFIKEVLDKNKAENIEKFNLENSEYMANGVVIATAMVDRHMLALESELRKELKPAGEEFLHSDASDEWIALDLGDIIIHIMTSKAREKYHMEEFLREFEARKKANEQKPL